MKKIVLFFLILGIVQAGMAQQGRGNGRDGKPHGQNRQQKGPEFLAEKLELSDEQRTKFEELVFEHQKKMISYKSDLGIKESQLRSEMIMDDPQRKVIDDLITDISKVREDMYRNRIDHRMSIRTILNEKQRLQFDQIRIPGNRHERRGHPRGR